MDTSDEIPLEDHRYFQARLSHLEQRQPVMLLVLLERRELTGHLRSVVMRAMNTLGDFVINQGLPLNQADELVMKQIVADPHEKPAFLKDRINREKLRTLLRDYRATLPSLPRTYLSQQQITE